jgi:hypothetical protein
MRRTPYRVDPAVREFVMRRDRECFLAKVEPGHICRDLWGVPHAPDDLSKLSLEHVKDQPRMGVRAPSDAAHMLALCAYSNVAVPNRSQRNAMRAYLAGVGA